MKFTPKSEKEISESRLIPDGEYPFEVSSADDKVSKAGNDMIELWLRVYLDNGKFVQIPDYLMEKMEFKLRHACDACGIIDKYESGELDASDFEGKSGYVKIGTQPANGDWPAKNTVKDYILKDGTEHSKPKASVEKKDDFEDDIPF